MSGLAIVGAAVDLHAAVSTAQDMLLVGGTGPALIAFKFDSTAGLTDLDTAPGVLTWCGGFAPAIACLDFRSVPFPTAHPIEAIRCTGPGPLYRPMEAADRRETDRRVIIQPWLWVGVYQGVMTDFPDRIKDPRCVPRYVTVEIVSNGIQHETTVDAQDSSACLVYDRSAGVTGT